MNPLPRPCLVQFMLSLHSALGQSTFHLSSQFAGIRFSCEWYILPEKTARPKNITLIFVHGCVVRILSPEIHELIRKQYYIVPNRENLKKKTWTFNRTNFAWHREIRIYRITICKLRVSTGPHTYGGQETKRYALQLMHSALTLKVPLHFTI